MRYVVLLFDDDNQAGEFVQAVGRPGGFFYLKGDGHFDTANNDEDASQVRVQGVYQRPTKFCDCPPEADPKVVKTKVHHWAVHTKCKKPLRNSFQHPKNLHGIDLNNPVHVRFGSGTDAKGTRHQYFGFRCSETPI